MNYLHHHPIILLGGNGYVGNAFQNYFREIGQAYITLSRGELDYADPRVLQALLERAKPLFLINCAGYNGKPNVDACEKDKATCYFLNAVLPGRIAEACHAARVPWGHLSSGCIYSGPAPRESGYIETDSPNFSHRAGNASTFSKSKALGEEILANEGNVYIWRLRAPYNHENHTRNFIVKVRGYKRLVDADNSLSHLNDFVKAAYECWKKQCPYGTYHLTNPGYITTRMVAEILNKYGILGEGVSFFEDEASFMQNAATAHRSSCILDTSKAAASGIHMRPAAVSLEDSIATLAKTLKA